MTRTLLLAAVALFATAASAQTAALEAEIERLAANAEEEGWTLVAGPTVVENGAEPVPFEVDLEAGTDYFVKVVCAEGSGLDPDIYTWDPNGGDFSYAADETDTDDELLLMPAISGTYTIEVPVFGMGCEGLSDDGCAYAYMVVQL